MIIRKRRRRKEEVTMGTKLMMMKKKMVKTVEMMRILRRMERERGLGMILLESASARTISPTMKMRMRKKVRKELFSFYLSLIEYSAL